MEQARLNIPDNVIVVDDMASMEAEEEARAQAASSESTKVRLRVPGRAKRLVSSLIDSSDPDSPILTKGTLTFRSKKGDVAELSLVP